MYGCDVLNKRGFARPYVLSEHTLVYKGKNLRNRWTQGPAGGMWSCLGQWDGTNEFSAVDVSISNYRSLQWYKFNTRPLRSFTGDSVHAERLHCIKCQEKGSGLPCLSARVFSCSLTLQGRVRCIPGPTFLCCSTSLHLNRCMGDC